MKYSPSKIERKWQKYWEAKGFYNTKDSVESNPPSYKATEGQGKNYMLLTEFAYPSGNLHMGHWDAFSLPDILARYLRMKGHNVLYPTGFDAFGLPAENAAIKNNIHPEKWTKQNIAYMTKQLKSMGATFDWSREVSTIDPEYYRWTQWMFLEFYKKGLAYRAKTMVNWCPKDKTVLANEQVIDGHCDRCGTQVVQKELAQWMFKITKFADELIDDMEGLDWPNTTKLAQKNWIGRSEGAIVNFKTKMGKDIQVFTTRPDTIFGATFLVVSPEMAQKWIDAHGDLTSSEVKQYVKDSLTKSELKRQENREKTGVDTLAKAINPATEQEIPIWVADYVLGNYGTGAIMAVPAHDERDFEFAKKFNLPIKQVIEPVSGESVELPFTEEGRVINSEKFSWANGLLSQDAKNEIIEEFEHLGIAKAKKNYRLRDWILSRQRYWGVPIPMINCQKCGYIEVPEKDLPIKLPPLKDFKPADDGRSPLAKAEKWLKVKCPKCDGPAERETDTMDTFVDSSWYFLRYTDPNNKKEFASKEKMSHWLPVSMYVGGAEHNTMHLLYSRFFIKALHELGHVDFKEPFIIRRNHGIILGPDGQKMSKSKGNIVDPDLEVKKYGADTVRMYLAFVGPYEQTTPWDPKGINGVYRFLNRVWNYAYDDKIVELTTDASVERAIHKAIKKVGEDIKGLHFNTAVSELMIVMNAIDRTSVSKNLFESFLKILAPLAPHITEELWQGALKNKQSIHLESWPEYNETIFEDELIKIVVQINGRVRDTLSVKKGLSEEEVNNMALARENVKKHMTGSVKKTIYVKDKLINLVI